MPGAVPLAANDLSFSRSTPRLPPKVCSIAGVGGVDADACWTGCSLRGLGRWCWLDGGSLWGVLRDPWSEHDG